MTAPAAREIIDALRLPASARVDQRVPKKLFLEQGAPTAADKRLLQDGIEEVLWIAVLKPETIGVPAYRDDNREYLEITLLTAKLRSKAKAVRLTELIHRAIPYPVLLLTEQDGATTISTAQKRHSLGETAKTILEGDVVAAALNGGSDVLAAFASSIALTGLPCSNLYELYSAWDARLHALEAANLTGRYTVPQTPDESEERRNALADHARITREIAGLRAKAAKETQINRRVDLNLAIQRLEAELAAATEKL